MAGKAVILLRCLVFFSCALLFVDGLQSPRWMLEEKRQKYREHEKCMIRRDDELKTFQDSERHIALFAMKGSHVQLKCFECLDPSDEELLEDVWKPNGSFIRRKVGEFIDKVKEVVKRFKQKAKEVDKNQTATRENAYCWEYLDPSGSEWSTVIDMVEPKESFAKASKIIKNFISENKQRYFIGDHFELGIKNATVSDTGWYRCVQCSNTENISRAYFLDVFPEYSTEMKEYSEADDLASQIYAELEQYNVQIFGKASLWSKCNKCGDGVIGESKRQVSCYVKPLKNSQRSDFADTGIPALQIFGELPCTSSLIPPIVRAKIRQYPVYEEFRACEMNCSLPKNETRKVEAPDESGSLFEFDKLPPGEFTLHERLPPLKRHVHRKAFRVIEEKPLVLDCGLRNDEGILWRWIPDANDDITDVNSATLIKLNPDGRKILNSDGQIIIKSTKFSDSGLYSCSTLSKGLISTFKVFVVADPAKSKNVISWLQRCIRFVSFSCLIILVFSVMFSANKSVKKAENGNKK